MKLLMRVKRFKRFSSHASSVNTAEDDTDDGPSAQLSLWDRAYEALREEGDLVDQYERLLSRELGDHPPSTVGPQDTARQEEGSDRTENNKIHTDPDKRQAQLKTITDLGLHQADQKRTKYTIFGHTYVLRDQVSHAAQFVQAFKDLVSEAVKVSPEASLAWAGVCILLPVLTNPQAAEEANRDGFLYVTSRARYYVELERLLWSDNLSASGLRSEFHNHIVDLYQHILEFQIKTVLRFYRRWVANIGRDLIRHDPWEKMVSKIKELERVVREESNTVNTISARDTLEAISERVEQHYRNMQSLLAVAEKQLDEQRRTNQILEDRPIALPVANKARYDSADVQDSPKCESGTRLRIRDAITRWADEDSKDTLFWLVGPAGTGKSTIARTLAQSFANEQRLAAGYFFKRGDQGRNDTSRLFPTLAAQLSEAIPPFKGCLRRYLGDLNEEAVEQKGLHFQFDKLLRLPLADLTPADTSPRPWVIVIDALDECERPKHLAGILSLLSELRKITQVRLRVLLTSRSAPNISDAFCPLLESQTARCLELHREFSEDTKTDIQTFLETRFADIRTRCRVQQYPWPEPEVLDRLVQLATHPEPLFIYAATLCRFVYDEQQPRNPKKQLARWLKQCEDNKSQLHQIYDPILVQIVAGGDEAEFDRQLQFLGALALLATPLSAPSLAALLAVDMDDVNWWLPELHAVLDIPRELHKPLRFLHKSFTDYLLDSDGSSASAYHVDIMGTHRLLAEKCIQRMEAGLKQDICDIRKLDATRDEISQEVIDHCIPPDLEYACLHWVHHLHCSGQSVSTNIQAFLYEHFLHWLEALSLLGRVSDSAIAVRGLLELIKHFPSMPLEFVDFIKDATRVLSSFGSIIEHLPLQTYAALLFFAPAASKVRQKLWNQRMPKLDPIEGVKLDWDAYLQTLEGHTDMVVAVAFSPDGQVIASASFDHTVRLWSTATGIHLQTLTGHSEPVKVVAFYGNEILASGSRDGTVRIWNLTTGQLRQTLDDNRGTVIAAAFLPDGDHLVSTSITFHSEVSVRLWDLKNNTPPKGLLQSYANSFKDATLSPDSQLLAARLFDNTIQIWNLVTGTRQSALTGHSDSINAMNFSPNNKLLASSSYDDTFRLWRVADGVQIHVFQSNDSPVNRVAFSLDGQNLAAASDDNIRIWNVADGIKQNTPLVHRGVVFAVAFSPDSQLLASGSSDGTIKIWDMVLRTPKGPVETHDDYSFSEIVFSRGGQLVASSSGDKTVQLWNVSTGLCYSTLSGHSDWVTDVIFSPDSNLIASFDGSIRVWNVENGSLQQAIDNRSGLVLAVDYSTDGKLIASASVNTITLYNAIIGDRLFTLKGHTDDVHKVAFSPDSQILASKSLDGTIRLWETKTGMTRCILRPDHWNYEIIFSPNSQFLASIWYRSIVIWNTMSGAQQQTLEADERISATAFSPNNQLLAIETGDIEEPQAIELWDATTGEFQHTLQCLDRGATGILFSPDSQLLAVASLNRTVWLWSTTTYEHLYTIDNPNDSIIKLKFSPDGLTLAIASRDKAIRLWNTITGLQIQTIEYNAGFLREITFFPDDLLVSVSHDGPAYFWGIWGPITLEFYKYALTADPQSSAPEPALYEANLDRDEEWITSGSERLIWLPSEYRPQSWARRGSTIFIGCSSGRVLQVRIV